MNEVVRAFLENEQKLRVVKRLGRGGFGEVYEVESPSGVRSAVKVSLDPIDGKNAAVKKELENLDVVKDLTRHPHIVNLLDFWLVAHYLVTRWELATDGSLREKLEEYEKQGQKGLPQELLLEWMKEVAEAVDFLNSKGIYHRDIKPSNLLLFHGHVKIADLGLAKVVGASTASHTGSGTMGYIPLEAWQEHRLTSTVDLYSLAATYVKLRTGEDPFGRTPHEVVERQKSGNPVVMGLRPEEVELVRRALATRPEERPQEGAVAWVRSVSETVQEKRRPKPVAPPASIPSPTARSQTIEHDTSNGLGTKGAIGGAIAGVIVGAIGWVFDRLLRRIDGDGSHRLRKE